MRTLSSSSCTIFLLLGCSDHGLHENSRTSEAEEVYDTGSPDVNPPDDPDPNTLTAGLKGRICDPSGGYWVVGATASVEWDGNGDGDMDFEVLDHTDGDGRFTLLDLPPGPNHVEVAKGSFSTSIDVDLVAGEILELADPSCLDRDNIDIAVVTGEYDDIGEILTNLTLSFDSYDGISSTGYMALLSDPGLMAHYDIIFLNCGIEWSWLSQQEQIGANIVDYVQQGGSLYASDWAYWFIEKSYPDLLDFSGDDATVGDAFHGAPGSFIARVVDTNMQGLLGSNTAEIYFNYNAWAVAQSAGTAANVLVKGDMSLEDGTLVTDSPLSVRLAGGDRVIYTAFHNEAQTTIDMDLLLLEIILSL
jgi:hypothetical protein